MRTKLAALVIGATLMVGALPMWAHHSFDAEYDRTKSREFTGTVTKVEWMNPHARFYLDVKDAAGKVTNWEFELGSPNGLLRQGWKKDSIKIGDVITCKGSLAKDGANLANASQLKLADGRTVGAASSGDAPKTN